MTSSLSYAVWALILAVGLVLWCVSYARPSAVARPAEVVSRVVTHPILRVCLLLGFIWLGWHLFAR